MEQPIDLKLKRIGNYTITGKTLGKGHFARVEEGYHTILKAKVAIKIISTREITDEYVLKHYKREAEIMSKISHPNIIYLFETIETSKHYYIITEIGSGGDLCNFVKSQRYGKLDEKRARPLAKQLVSAVGYLHQIEIVHRDLKMENILLDNSRERIKLVDFGLSNFCKHNELLDTHCGSPEYAAPELYISDRKYGPEVDIWSIGIIIYGMLVGKLPFYKYIQKSTDNSEKKSPMYESQIGLTMKHHKILMEFSHSVRIVITKILKPDPCKRITMKELCKNIWISCFDINGYPVEDSNWKNNVISKISNYLSQPIPEIYNKILNFPYGPLGGIYNIGRFFHINRKRYGYPCKCSHMKKKICDCFYRTKMSSKITSRTQSLELITQMQTASLKNDFVANKNSVKYKKYEELQQIKNQNRETNLLEKSSNIQSSQDNNLNINDVWNTLDKKRSNNDNNKNDNDNNKSHNSPKSIDLNKNCTNLNSLSSKNSKKSNVTIATNNLHSIDGNDNCTSNDKYIKNPSTINSPSPTSILQTNCKPDIKVHQDFNFKQNNESFAKPKKFVKENATKCSINDASNNTNMITTNTNITTSTIITEVITANSDRTASNIELINIIQKNDRNIVNANNDDDLIKDDIKNKNFQNNTNIKPKKKAPNESINIQQTEKEENINVVNNRHNHPIIKTKNNNNDNVKNTGINNKSKDIKKSSKLTSIKMINYLNEKFSQAFCGIYSSTNKTKVTNLILSDNGQQIVKNYDKINNVDKNKDNIKNLDSEKTVINKNVDSDVYDGYNDTNIESDKNYDNNKSYITPRSNHSNDSYKKFKGILEHHHSHLHHTRKVKSFQKSTKKQSKNSLGITALSAINNLKKFQTFNNTRETTIPTYSNIKNIHYSNLIYFNKNRNSEIMKIYENNGHTNSYNSYINLSSTNSNDVTPIKTYKNHGNHSIPEIVKHNCSKTKNNNSSNILKQDNEKIFCENDSISKTKSNEKRKKTKSTTHTLKQFYNSKKNHFHIFKKQNLPAVGTTNNEAIVDSIADSSKSDYSNNMESNNGNCIKNSNASSKNIKLKNCTKLNKCDKKQTMLQNEGDSFTTDEYNKNKNEMDKIRRENHKTATIKAYKYQHIYKTPELNKKLIKIQNNNTDNDYCVSIDDENNVNKHLLNQKIKNSIKIATSNKLINNNVENAKRIYHTFE